MGRSAVRAAVTAVAVLVSSSVAGDAVADIDAYTDADGVVHFTNLRADPRYKVYLRGDGQNARAPRSGVFPVPPTDRELARFTRYDEWIREASALYQIPEPLVRAVIKVESDYDPRAVSYAGACGLMQLMPETAAGLQVKDIHDPRENIFGGVRFLRILANTFNGDLELTIAAYNAGEGAVIQWGGIPPYQQTQGYVVKVSRYYRRYRTMADAVEASLGD